MFGQTFHLSYTSKWFTNEVQILYLAFDYCLWNVLCLMDVSCEWATAVDHSRSLRNRCIFGSLGEILRGVNPNLRRYETVLLSDYYLSFINLLLWLTVSQITQTDLTILQYIRSMKPFQSVINMPDTFNDVLHRILSLFLSSIAIVGVDFCLVCLIDKSIQKYFLLPFFFFCLIFVCI